MFLQKMHERRGIMFLPICLRVANARSQRNWLIQRQSQSEGKSNGESEVSFLKISFVLE